MIGQLCKKSNAAVPISNRLKELKLEMCLADEKEIAEHGKVELEVPIPH
jgi:hypothetical protein